ncbi:MAG TPA: nicotinamidase [Candidatus Saccharimonadales bacterium]|nr:nicotinamidase [Candidatus Saccharimonadales bacterium]
MQIQIDKQTNLIVVDVQNDFCPGGALAVPDGDKIISALNEYIKKFSDSGAPIIFTRDWHPPDHSSFKSQGGPWPSHCVQNSEGAKFHSNLMIPENAEIVSKADRKDEAYSFFRGTNLAEELHQRGIKRLLVGGLATDYCVKETVLDGLRHGFEVYHLDDASRGVNVNRDDSELALREMVSRGAKRIKLSDVIASSTATRPS